MGRASKQEGARLGDTSLSMSARMLYALLSLPEERGLIETEAPGRVVRRCLYPSNKMWGGYP